MKKLLIFALGVSLLGGSVPLWAGKPVPMQKASKRKGKKMKTRKRSSSVKSRKPKTR